MTYESKIAKKGRSVSACSVVLLLSLMTHGQSHAAMTFQLTLQVGPMDPVVRSTTTAIQFGAMVEQFWGGENIVFRSGFEVASNRLLGGDFPPYGTTQLDTVDTPCLTGFYYEADFQAATVLTNGNEGQFTAISTGLTALCPLVCAPGF